MLLLLILDIGCGSLPEGDVNLDLFQGNSPHHRHFINSKKIPNFVNGDAQNLPFRKGSITGIHSNQLLEHLRRPLNHIEDCYNILADNGWLIIKIPNKPITNESPNHLYSWSQTSFTNFLGLVFPYVRVNAYTRMGRMESDRMYRLLELIKKPNIQETLKRAYSQVFNGILIGVCRKC